MKAWHNLSGYKPKGLNYKLNEYTKTHPEV